MQKVTVYYFERYDVSTHRNVRSNRPATLAAIAKAKGKAFRNTAQEVDGALLDSNGFLPAA